MPSNLKHEAPATKKNKQIIRTILIVITLFNNLFLRLCKQLLVAREVIFAFLLNKLVNFQMCRFVL